MRKPLNVKEIKNKVFASKQYGSTCHECTWKDQAENYNEYIVVEKEILIMKKYIENKEINP